MQNLISQPDIGGLFLTYLEIPDLVRSLLPTTKKICTNVMKHVYRKRQVECRRFALRKLHDYGHINDGLHVYFAMVDFYRHRRAGQGVWNLKHAKACFKNPTPYLRQWKISPQKYQALLDRALYCYKPLMVYHKEYMHRVNHAPIDYATMLPIVRKHFARKGLPWKLPKRCQLLLKYGVLRCGYPIYSMPDILWREIDAGYLPRIPIPNIGQRMDDGYTNQPPSKKIRLS